MGKAQCELAEHIGPHGLESYLFETVHQRFQKVGRLDAFDFFCIVIWKANRAKSKIALKLLVRDEQNRTDLNTITNELTSHIHDEPDPRQKMRILVEDWGFRLPIASAILTVLYPDDFTVYDRRVCDAIGNYHKLENKIRFDALWRGYCDFVKTVKETAPAELCLREKDRYLWGKSFALDLRESIQNLFQKKS